MSTNTITRTSERVAIVLDLDERPLLEVDADDAQLREPDFFDDGFAYWIGPDATVLVEEAAIANLERVLARGGVPNQYPTYDGILVQPHGEVPAYNVSGRKADVVRVWMLARRTLGN